MKEISRIRKVAPSWNGVNASGKGEPTEPIALGEFLDSALKFCAQMEYPYPKVFLLRLKQLQRGEWSRQEVGPGGGE